MLISLFVRCWITPLKLTCPEITVGLRHFSRSDRLICVTPEGAEFFHRAKFVAREPA
jgi:hypothetical protein